MSVRAEEPGGAPAAPVQSSSRRSSGGAAAAGRAGGEAPAARLVSRTVELVPPGGQLLDLLPAGQAPLSWVREGDGLVGWGEAARVDTWGGERLADARAWWAGLVAGAEVHDEVGGRGAGPVAFGSFAFADGSPAGGTLVVPRTVVGCREGRWWLTHMAVGGSPLPTPSAVPTVGAVPARVAEPAAPVGTAFSEGSVSESEWRRLVERAVERIRRGDLDKVVLARDLLAQAAGPIDVRAVLRRLAAAYPTTWTFSVDGLVGATPELLVRVEGGLVGSRVLAGTIRPTGDGARDLALAASLAASPKELDEHRFAVRSVADALAPYCAGIDVPATPFVLPLANVMHLATDVTGVLQGDACSLDLAAALHPSAAVCGTPRQAAAELITELEPFDRGRYAGPVGWLDAAGEGEWGLALRCGEVQDDPRQLRLFAGCGIVAGSDPAAELAESAAKLVAMQDALSG